MRKSQWALGGLRKQPEEMGLEEHPSEEAISMAAWHPILLA